MVTNNSEDESQTPTYAKIDTEVKKRATMYVTKCKLLDKKTNTMNALIEEALDSYMIQHPL